MSTDLYFRNRNIYFTYNYGMREWFNGYLRSITIRMCFESLDILTLDALVETFSITLIFSTLDHE